MKMTKATIIIWQSKAFIPTKARYSNGISTFIEPIQVVNPILDELVPAVEKVLKTGTKLLPDPTREDVKTQFNLLPRITGAHSWKKLSQQGMNYVVEQTEKEYTLEIASLDSKGRWVYDLNKMKTYPPETELSVVIRDLLEDLAMRPKM